MKLGLFGVLVGIIVEVLQLVGRKEPAAAVRRQYENVTIYDPGSVPSPLTPVLKSNTPSGVEIV